MSATNNRIRCVPLPWETRRPFAIVIDDVFTRQECDELIRRSEKQGYEEALVNIGRGRQKKLTDIRNSDRCIIDDPVSAQEMWTRITQAMGSVSSHEEIGRDTLHSPESGWTAVGLNERLRILRYGPGTYFKPHYDGSYVRGREVGMDRMNETSFVTCQLYLNEGCKGGETRFLSPNEDMETKVTPKTGSILLFQHRLLHEGSPVIEGQKYVIRTDVMYTDRGPGHEYSREPIRIGGASAASDSFEAMEED